MAPETTAPIKPEEELTEPSTGAKALRWVLPLPTYHTPSSRIENIEGPGNLADLPPGMLLKTKAQLKILPKQQAKLAQLESGVPMPSERYYGIWWVMDNLNRPINAAIGTMFNIATGADWETIKHSAVDHLKGDERTYFYDLMDTTPLWFQSAAYRATNALIKPFAGKTDQGSALAMAVGGPLGTIAYEAGRELTPEEWSRARTVFGLVGDASLAGIFTPGAGALAIGKIRGVQRFGPKIKEAIAGTDFDRLLRSTVVRSTGNSVIDNLKSTKINRRAYISSDMNHHVVEALKAENVVRKEFMDVVPKLAEENLDNVIPFIQKARAGQIPAEQIAEVAKAESRLLQNRDAVLKAITSKATDEEIEALFTAARAQKNVAERAIDLQIGFGKSRSRLGAQIQDGLDEARTELAESFQTSIQNEIKSLVMKAKSLSDKAPAIAKSRAMGEVVGKQGQKNAMATINKALQEIQKEIQAARRAAMHIGTDADKGIAALSRGNPEAYRNYFSEYLRTEGHNIIGRSMKKGGDGSAIHGLWDEMIDAATEVSPTAGVSSEAMTRAKKFMELIEQTPAYSHHYLSKDALWYLGTKSGKAARETLTASGKGNRVASEIARAFVDNNNVPLSREQIERIVRSGKYGPTAGGNVPLRGDHVELFNQIEALRKMPLLEAPSSVGAVLRRFRGKSKVANFLEEDSRPILAQMAHETGRAVGATEYFSDAMTIFGRKPPGIGAARKAMDDVWDVVQSSDADEAVLQGVVDRIGPVVSAIDSGDPNAVLATVRALGRFVGKNKKNLPEEFIETIRDRLKPAVRGIKQEIKMFDRAEEARFQSEEALGRLRAGPKVESLRRPLDPTAVMEKVAPLSRAKPPIQRLAKPQQFALGNIIKEIPELSLDVAARGTWVPIQSIKGAKDFLASMPHYNDIYVPREVGHQVVKTAQRFFAASADHPVLKIYDGLKDYWIKMSLPLAPAFHSRNTWGGFNQMNIATGFCDPHRFAGDFTTLLKTLALQSMAIGDNVGAAKRLKFSVPFHNMELDGVQAMDVLRRVGNIDHRFVGAELARDTNNMLVKPWKRGAFYNPLSSSNAVIQGGTALGRFVENLQSATLFLNRLEHGDSFAVAARTTRRVLGDLRSEASLPFEKDFLSRIFYFWRWNRHNIPFQLEKLFLGSYPARTKMLGALRGYQSQLSDEDVEMMVSPPGEVPTYLKEGTMLPLKRDPKTGELTAGLLRAFVPLMDLDNLVGPQKLARFAVANLPFFAQKAFEVGSGVEPYTKLQWEGRLGERFGVTMPKWQANVISNIRFLRELDRADPWGRWHRQPGDLEGEGPVREMPPYRALAALTGFTITKYRKEKAMIPKRELDIDLIRHRISYEARKHGTSVPHGTILGEMPMQRKMTLEEFIEQRKASAKKETK